MKKGFALITAVIFVVLIATLGALSLSLSSSSVKHSSNVFLREQAELLAISATEHAVLAMQAHDYTTSCINTIESKFPDDKNSMFTANITINYIGNNLPKDCNILYSGGDETLKSKYINDTNTKNTTKASYKVAIIDVIVTSDENLTSEPIRFHKKTTQSLNFLTLEER